MIISSDFRGSLVVTCPFRRGLGLYPPRPTPAKYSKKKPSGSIGNFTLAMLPGYRAAAMLRACRMLLACTATAKRAVSEWTSIETFTVWITSFFLHSTYSGPY